MTETDYRFATVEGQEYFNWLNSLSDTGFKQLFPVEWKRVLSMFDRIVEGEGENQVVKPKSHVEVRSDTIW